MALVSYQFTAEFMAERILKINQHLVNLKLKQEGAVF